MVGRLFSQSSDIRICIYKRFGQFICGKYQLNSKSVLISD